MYTHYLVSRQWQGLDTISPEYPGDKNEQLKFSQKNAFYSCLNISLLSHYLRKRNLSDLVGQCKSTSKLKLVKKCCIYFPVSCSSPTGPAQTVSAKSFEKEVSASISY